MLHIADGAEHGGDGVARLARIALAQRYPHIVHAARRGRAAHRHRLAYRLLQHVPDCGFGLGGAELRSVGEAEPRAADAHGLEQRILAPGDRGQMEHRVVLQEAVVADIFAIRTFRLDEPALVQIALEHQFGIGRHAHVIGHAFHHRQRRTAYCANHLELVHRRRRGDGGEKIRRMAAHRERHRQPLAFGHAGLIERAQIAGRVEIDAGGARPPQHQPPAADIGEAVLRVAGVIDAGGNIGRAVEPVLHVHRQRCEIGVVAGQHHLVHGRLARGDLDRGDRMLQAFPQHCGKSGFIGVECRRQAPACAHDVADELGSLRPDRAKPHCVRIAVEHGRDIDQIDRRVMHGAFALLHQSFDEMTQAELVGIDFMGIELAHEAFSPRLLCDRRNVIGFRVAHKGEALTASQDGLSKQNPSTNSNHI